MVFLCTLVGWVLGGCWHIIDPHQTDLITCHHPVQWVLAWHYQGNGTTAVFAFFNCRGSHEICCIREKFPYNSPPAHQPLCHSQTTATSSLWNSNPTSKTQMNSSKSEGWQGWTQTQTTLCSHTNSPQHRTASGISPQARLHINTSARWMQPVKGFKTKQETIFRLDKSRY